MLVGLLRRSLAIMLWGTVDLGHFQIYLHLRSVLLEALFLFNCSGLDSQLLVHQWIPLTCICLLNRKQLLLINCLALLLWLLERQKLSSKLVRQVPVFLLVDAVISVSRIRPIGYAYLHNFILILGLNHLRYLLLHLREERLGAFRLINRHKLQRWILCQDCLQTIASPHWYRILVVLGICALRGWRQI